MVRQFAKLKFKAPDSGGCRVRVRMVFSSDGRKGCTPPYDVVAGTRKLKAKCVEQLEKQFAALE